MVAALTLAAGASAASPVLEFAGSTAFPIEFTAHGGAVSAVLTDFEPELRCSGSAGEGEVTGPRSTLSRYVFTGCEAGVVHKTPCRSAEAHEGEIKTPAIEAELVFLNQARDEVAMLLAPHGGVYMSFECDGESVTALGPFLAPVGAVNQETTSFTASMSRLGAVQIPDEYEGPAGERLQAIPTAEIEGGGEPEPGTTGVELSFAIQTAAPLTIKAISAAEIEAKERDEAAAKAAADKKHQEEVDAATKKRAEEEATKAAKERERAKAKQRARQLSSALKKCRKSNSKQKRARCERQAKKRFGPRASQPAHHHA